jgi:hypothetical protein
VLNGNLFQLYEKPSRAAVRRIYVAEDHAVGAGYQVDIPVNSTWNGFKTPDTDSVLEPKLLCQGVVAARTLLSGKTTASGIRVMNSSDSNHRIHAGQCLGQAEPAAAEPVEEFANDTSSGDDFTAAVNDDSHYHNCPDHLKCIMNAFPAELTD